MGREINHTNTDIFYSGLNASTIGNCTTVAVSNKHPNLNYYTGIKNGVNLFCTPLDAFRVQIFNNTYDYVHVFSTTNPKH